MLTMAQHLVRYAAVAGYREPGHGGHRWLIMMISAERRQHMSSSGKGFWLGLMDQMWHHRRLWLQQIPGAGTAASQKRGRQHSAT
jgi:hypothetical protein